MYCTLCKIKIKIKCILFIFHLPPSISVKANELKVMGLGCPYTKLAPFESCHGHLHHDLMKICVRFLKTK